MIGSIFRTVVVAATLASSATVAMADFTVPFVDLCGVGGNAGTGEVLMAHLSGPNIGTMIHGATVEVTWTTHGDRPASSLGFLLEYNVSGTRRSLYVTGTDLGFTTPGAGTFHGTLSTDAFNGTADGGLPDFPTIFDIELVPDPLCEPFPNEVICGVWGTFENNSGQGTFSGITLHTDPPPPTCPVDWNEDGTVDVFDLLAYLDDWFAAAPAADLDLSPGITVFDLLTYLDGWFAVTGGAPCP